MDPIKVDFSGKGAPKEVVIPPEKKVLKLIISLIVTVIGARPYMSKFAAKYNNEINTFTANELGKLNKTEEPKTTASRKTVCSACGAKLDKGSSTCNYCGKEN